MNNTEMNTLIFNTHQYFRFFLLDKSVEILIIVQGYEHFKVLNTYLIHMNWNNPIMFVHILIRLKVLLN